MGWPRTLLLGSALAALAACGESAPRLVTVAGTGGETTGGVAVASSTGGAPAASSTGGAPASAASGGVTQTVGGTTTGGAPVVAGSAGTPTSGGSNAGSGGQASTTPAARVKPNVLLVVDRSLSMQQVFGGETRWAALRAALFDPALGIVPRFESKVYFGLALFTGPQLVAMQAPSSECPILVEVPAGASNNDELVAAYEASEPFGTTPTGASLDVLWPKLAALDETAFPGPHVIVLATDGEPNTCENNQDMATGRAGSEGAITKAHAAGIRTYVLSVGDDVAAEHLRRIANLGQGLPAEDPTERYLRADEPAQLRAALDRLFSELTTP